MENWNGIPQYFTMEDSYELPPNFFTMPNTEEFGFDDFREEDIPPASTFGSGSGSASLPAYLHDTLANSVGPQYQLAVPQAPALAPQPPAMQQGQALPPQPLPGVLGPNTQGARVSKPGRNRRAAPPAQGQRLQRKVKANACKRCRKKKISCKSANDEDPCDGCKVDGSECDRSGADMRTNKSTTAKYNEAVKDCENLLAQLHFLAKEVEQPGVCPVALVKAIGDDTTPLGEMLERFFPGAGQNWSSYIDLVRQNYPLPAAEAGRKLLEYRAMFQTLEAAVVGHIRALGGEQPSSLVTALALKAFEGSFLGGLAGEDYRLGEQLCNCAAVGDNSILESLIFPALERRVSAIAHI